MVELGATISGNVTNANNEPVSGSGSVYDLDDEYVSDFSIDLEGAYVTSALKPGTYKLSIKPYSPYASEYWGDSATLSGATTITLAQDQQLSGINPEVELGGSISGTVNAPSRSERILVCLYDEIGTPSDQCVDTDDNGQ